MLKLSAGASVVPQSFVQFMNYRHIYHAGNFADIFKHCALALTILYMQRKPAAFRVIDTHAGAGFYDLRSQAANKTAEWQNGILRFLQAAAAPEAASAQEAEGAQEAESAKADYPQLFARIAARRPLLAPYMQALAAAQQAGGAKADTLRSYPGSPCLVRALLRRQDRLTAIELHEEEHRLLQQRFLGDYQSKILHLDGRLALKAQLPPKEKRGLILIDPPFEQADEFAAMAQGMAQALRRFPQGVYMLWYPVKNYSAIQDFADAIQQIAAEKNAGAVLRAELRIRRPSPEPKLDGSGLMLINPPYILAEQLRGLAPLLLRAFAEDSHAALKLEFLRSA